MRIKANHTSAYLYLKCNLSIYYKANRSFPREAKSWCQFASQPSPSIEVLYFDYYFSFVKAFIFAMLRVRLFNHLFGLSKFI